MNEKALFKFFLLILVSFVFLIGLVSLFAQRSADKSIQSFFYGFQRGYSVVVTELVTKHVLNGNNREVVDILERMKNSKAIDAYKFRSSVNDFETSNLQEGIEAYYRTVVDIKYSEGEANAASIELLFLRDGINASQREFLNVTQNGWVAAFFLILVLLSFIFVFIRKENIKLNRFIDRFLTEEIIIGTEPSEAWSPVVNTIKNSKARLDFLNLQIEKAKISEAIARTTQMLAHDVRKPFALFRMTLHKVKSVSSPQLMQQVLKEALPEVERSMASVNGLIADVLNVGGEFHLVLKPVRLAPVVEDAAEELRRLHPTRNLRLRIDVASDLWVEADDTRLPRVFLNILSNAIEAVEGPEVQLWVTSQQIKSGDEQIEIRVGNRGSFIPADTREKLFDLFFTSGKKGGTGLGLAIVKKIIEGHGSVVKCHSARTTDEPQGMVEFTWTLKRSMQPFETERAIESSVEAETPAAADRLDSTQTLNAEFVDQPQVVFLDDSPLARWVWEAKLKSNVSLQCFAGPRDFWVAVDNNSIVLENLHTIITDHYFAADEKITGLEFASELRSRQFKGRILLASNGDFRPEELAGIVDKIVDKQPVEWERL